MDMRLDATSAVRISAGRESVRLSGAVSRSVRFTTDSFFVGLPRLPTHRCLDLLHIATGVYAVDRLIKRPGTALSDSRNRTFDLSFSARDIEFWSQAEISAQIIDILEFLTDEDWDLRFEPLPLHGREDGHQHPLSLPQRSQPGRVALYSGGLDSAAGLANRLISGADRYVLVTVGHQSWLRKKAAEQVAGLQAALDIEPLPHASVVTALRGGGGLRLRDQELTQRSRSFLFSACAVAVAAAHDIAEIDVFENGVGAVNFPLMTGMLVGGLATRGAHPTFLRLMSRLASAVTDIPIRFHLPFATVTKAQMLAPLGSYRLGHWLQQSRSCVHSSWRIPGKKHCGTCPACIERRQAFAAAEVDESIDGYSTDILSRPSAYGMEADYFRLYRDEAKAWLATDPRPRRRMDAHLRITGVPETEYQSIIDLQTRHSLEVRSVYGV